MSSSQILCTFLLLALCSCEKSGGTAGTAGKGRFEPALAEVQLLANGRDCKLLKSFSYIDSQHTWTAPEGEIVDGASIPQTFWTIIGGPYEGKYRFAAIVHDRYCHDHGGRTWKDVHKMFYDACITGGTDPQLAMLMYAAVYHFGPRWADSEKGAKEIELLIAPERARMADELLRFQRVAVNMATSQPADVAPRMMPSEKQYRDLVFAPRAARADSNASPELQKWDRIRAFLGNRPDASPDEVEAVQ